MNQKQPLPALLIISAAFTFPLFLSSCAQFSQWMGTSTEPAETAPQATVTAPPAQKATASPAPKAGHAPSHSTQSPTIAQPGAPDSKQAHDKAVAEKDQSKKDKKASVASDKKSAKKPSKPEAQPSSEDVFLPPVPLPSKPAAIGGSGG